MLYNLIFIVFCAVLFIWLQNYRYLRQNNWPWTGSSGFDIHTVEFCVPFTQEVNKYRRVEHKIIQITKQITGLLNPFYEPLWSGKCLLTESCCFGQLICLSNSVVEAFVFLFTFFAHNLYFKVVSSILTVIFWIHNLKG